MSIKSVLIIGAGGFTGRHLVNELKSSWKIIDSREYGLNLTSLISIRRALEQTLPDAVVNLGAIATLSESDRKSIFEVNAFGVLNLLEAMQERSFSGRFITASSAYVYGLWDGHEPIPESHPIRPLNLYACAKALAEHFCEMHSDRIDTVIARPFNAIGRGHRDSFLVPKIVKHFRERASCIDLGNRKVARSYSDVRDVARMYRAVLDADTPPRVLNFCNPKVVTIDAIVSCLTELTGHKILINENPSLFRPNDVTYQCGTTSELKLLGFSWKYDLMDTMKWMLEA